MFCRILSIGHYQYVILQELNKQNFIHCTEKIYNIKQFQVRLVTGVGRFTEMNYVFQILKENDQFEFLLGKGLNKVSLRFLFF